MPRDASVQTNEKLGDRLIQLGEAEESSITQASQDPTFDHLDTDFHLGLVSWLAWPCRHNRGAVVGRHVGIGAVDLGIVKAGPGDARLEIVRHDL